MVGDTRFSFPYYRLSTLSTVTRFDLETYRASIISRISGDLWILALSMIMTELGAGYGCISLRSPLRNALKSGVVKEPSTILQDRTPVMDIAGNIEYL